jgi:hypothetical protein
MEPNLKHQNHQNTTAQTSSNILSLHFAQAATDFSELQEVCL